MSLNVIGWYGASFYLTCDDLSKQLLRSISKKRHTAHQKLIQNDAHRPPVHGLAIALPENHLWGNVLWSSTHLREETKYYKMSSPNFEATFTATCI